MSLLCKGRCRPSTDDKLSRRAPLRSSLRPLLAESKVQAGRTSLSGILESRAWRRRSLGKGIRRKQTPLAAPNPLDQVATSSGKAALVEMRTALRTAEALWEPQIAGLQLAHNT